MIIESFHYEPVLPSGTKTKDRIRAAAYCRVSTLAEEQELSFEVQCEYYKKMIEGDRNKILVGIYGDHGISGLHSENRPQFQQMIADCRMGKIDAIYTKSISRFARNLKDFLKYADELKNMGINIYFEKEGMSTADENSELLFSIMAILAQEESNSLSQAHKWSIEHRNALGDPIRPACYGYIRDTHSTDGVHRWHINEEEAKRVRYAFQLRSKGHSYRFICNALNEMEKEGCSEKIWNVSTVIRLLKHEAYRGDLLTGKTYSTDFITGIEKRNNGERQQYYLEGHHEAIIDPEFFDKVTLRNGVNNLSKQLDKRRRT